jgi:pectinesterase
MRRGKAIEIRGFRALGGALVLLLGLAAPLAHAGNYLVDGNYSGTNGAAYTNPDGITFTAAYNNVAAALASTGGVPSGSSPTSPNNIYFAPGTYNVGTTSLSYSKNNVALIGLTGNPNDVVITSTLDSAYNTGSATIGTTGSATLQLKGNNQSAAYLTFANSTDTPYIANVIHQAESPTGTFVPTQTQSSNAPAVALLLQGDQQVFNNVKVLGYQDSLYMKGGRALFNNSTVSGDIDFIFANGTTVFNNSTINLDSDHSGGTITAASTDKGTSNGIVFLNPTITGNSMKGNPIIDPNNGGNANPTAANSMYLGRPWGWTQVGGDSSAVFVNPKIATNGGTPIIKSAGWLNWDSTELTSANNGGGKLQEDARYAEYSPTDLIGNPVDTSSRVGWSHQLVASQAAAYTVNNVFSRSYPWYGNGYPSTDTDFIGPAANNIPAAATGSANPSDPNYSWPAFWGDRNIDNETTNSTIKNDPGSYTDTNWTIAGDWDPTNQLNSIVQLPEPGVITLLGTVTVVPLLRRPRRK